MSEANAKFALSVDPDNEDAERQGSRGGLKARTGAANGA